MRHIVPESKTKSRFLAALGMTSQGGKRLRRGAAAFLVLLGAAAGAGRAFLGMIPFLGRYARLPENFFHQMPRNIATMGIGNVDLQSSLSHV